MGKAWHPATQKQLALIAALGGDTTAFMNIAEAGACIDKLKEEQRAKREAERAEKFALVPGAPKGKTTIEGDVVSTKVADTQFGLTHKFLVELDNGCRVYGTIPWDIRKQVPNEEDLKGRRVRITANFKRSDKDPHFSVYSHPKGDLLQIAVANT